MTERLYYDDPYLVRFAARVQERLQWSGAPGQEAGGHPAVILDRSAFYPTGGGQPHDVGSLNGVPVVDVIEREADGAVVHLLERALESGPVEGEVDWDRRFDLMQQHTGQHILSAVFLERLGANTVGFHLADEYATIDLDRAPLSVDELDDVEARASAVVFDDRSIVARFVPDEEVPSLPLRKQLAHEGPVRVVEIPGLDCSACGGTHVRATGEVGLIKITRSERRGTETRVEFLCGRRALADYRAKNAMVMDLAREFTVGHWELADLVHRLADDLKESRREVRRIRDALLDAEATALWQGAMPVGSIRIIRACLAGRAPDDLKHLAQRLQAHPRTVALLASGGESGEMAYLTFARSDDVDVHVGNLLREACLHVGGRGGGRPDFAQGGGPRGELVVPALDAAVQTLAASEGHRT